MTTRNRNKRFLLVYILQMQDFNMPIDLMRINSGRIQVHSRRNRALWTGPPVGMCGALANE